jgi:hypothetical protein
MWNLFPTLLPGSIIYVETEIHLNSLYLHLSHMGGIVVVFLNGCAAKLDVVFFCGVPQNAKLLLCLFMFLLSVLKTNSLTNN